MSLYRLQILVNSVGIFAIIATTLYFSYELYKEVHNKQSKRQFCKNASFDVSFLEAVALLIISMAVYPSPLDTTLPCVQLVWGLRSQIVIGRQQPLHWYNWI